MFLPWDHSNYPFWHLYSRKCINNSKWIEVERKKYQLLGKIQFTRNSRMLNIGLWNRSCVVSEMFSSSRKGRKGKWEGKGEKRVALVNPRSKMLIISCHHSGCPVQLFVWGKAQVSERVRGRRGRKGKKEREGEPREGEREKCVSATIRQTLTRK